MKVKDFHSSTVTLAIKIYEVIRDQVQYVFKNPNPIQ